MLTIWGRLNSRNVKKVAWLAEEIGLEYVRHDVGGAIGLALVAHGMRNSRGGQPSPHR